MTLWMEVTSDKYELPLIVARSVSELARITGVSPRTIRSAITHEKRGRTRSSKYKRVEVEDD